MILLNNTAAQTLQPGQTITFDNVLLKTGNGECCRNNAARSITTAKMRKCGYYRLLYQANVTSATADIPVGLSIQVAGVTLPETTTTFTPATADTEFGDISRETIVFNCGQDVTAVTVANTGENPVIVAPNATLLIQRISGGAD